ncbi:class I SAM-dependent methyltransferase [soil metagenome]
MVHDAAAQGYQRHAAAYQRGRPSYHPDLVALLVDRYGEGEVLELGAGTGILTLPLVAAGVDVIAIEPVEAMRTTLAERVPGAIVLAGTAESIPREDRSVDVVLASQSFHWFDAPAALDEIARVLRPSGRLVTVWNVRDEELPWVAAYTEVVDRHAADTPRYRSFDWRAAIDGDVRFTATDDWEVANPFPTDPQGVVDRALSTSFVAALDQADQDRVAAEIAAIVEPLGSSFDYPYRSELQAWTLAG